MACVRGLILGLAALAVAGCFSRSSAEQRCAKPQEYQASVGVSGIVVPEGLSEPARGQAYQLPSGGNKVLPADAGCLDRPPNFFRQDPAAAPEATPTPAPTPAPPG